MLLRLIEPDSGEIEFDGKDLLALGGEELRRQRREMQVATRVAVMRAGKFVEMGGGGADFASAGALVYAGIAGGCSGIAGEVT